MKSLRTKIKSLLLSFLAAIALIGSTSAWADSVTVSAKDSQGNPISSITTGNVVSLMAGAPVSGVDTIGQTVQSSWDPVRLPLSNLSSIVYPQGWSLSYSTDGGASWLSSAPTNISSINALKTSGTLVSGGSLAGKQVVTGTNSISAPSAPASIDITGGGDGWVAFFDPTNTRVYNIYHHEGPNAKVDCHNKLTGASCGIGFPASVPGAVTNNRSWGIAISDGRIFIPGMGGFSCLTSAGTQCTGGAFVNGKVSLGGGTGMDEVYEVAYANSKLYTADVASGKLLCFDPASNTACAENGTVLGTTHNLLYALDGTRLISVGNLVFFRHFDQLFCFDASTSSVCSGWTTKTVNAKSALMTLPNSAGQIVGICEFWNPASCYDLNGNAITGSTVTELGALSTSVRGTINNGEDYRYNNTSTLGSRVYFGPGDSGNHGDGYIGCWDASSSDHKCWSTWVIRPTAFYTVTADPSNPMCLWAVGDRTGIKTYDVTGPTPSAGCSTIVPVVDFPAATNGVRMGCAVTDPITSWVSFSVVAPNPTSALLTVNDTNAAAISNWAGLNGILEVDNSCTGCKKATWDLSNLAIATTGQNPTFKVTLAGVTAGASVSGALKAVGNAPELCWQSTTANGCPVSTNVGQAGPNGTTPTMPVPGDTIINGAGTYTPSGSSPVSYTTASTTLTQSTAPAANVCLGSLSGKVRKNGTSTGIQGATVTLTDGAGNPILDSSNQPITTTTSSDGSYSFANIYPNSSFSSPTSAQQYSVSVSQPTGYTLDGYNQSASSTSFSSASALLPLVSGGSTSGQLAAAQTAALNLFFTDHPQILSINKAPSAATFMSIGAGTAGSYIVTVTNSGLNATTGEIKFTDTLPTNMTVPSGSLTLLSGSSAGWGCSATGQTITCTNKPSGTATNLAAGSATDGSNIATIKYAVSLNLTTAAQLSATYQNSATFLNGYMGGDTRNPSSSCSTTTAPANPSVTPRVSADGLCAKTLVGVTQGTISVDKSLFSVLSGSSTITTGLSSYVVKPADKLTYKIALAETGNVSAAATTLTETIPLGTTYTGTNEGWVCATPTIAGSTCTQAVAVQKGASSSVNFTVTVANPISNAGLAAISNTISPGGNGTCVSCSVSNPTPPQLKISKSSAAASITALSNGTFTVTVTNVGGTATTGAIKFVDTLPAGLSYVSTTSGSIFICSNVGQEITCTTSTSISAGANAPVSFTVMASGTAQDLVNSVVVDATDKGGDVRTNTDTNSTPATPSAAGQNTISTSGLSAKAKVAVIATNTASVSGKVRKSSAGSASIAGINVVLKDAQGNVVATTSTDTNGNYRFDGLTPGTHYSVTFAGGNGMRILSAPENPAAQVNGSANANEISFQTGSLIAGNLTTEFNAVMIDPSGVIYDAGSRQPIAGAQVTLMYNGAPVPANQMVGGNNTVTTASDGSYALYLNGAAPAGTYTLAVTPPGCLSPTNCPSNSTYKPAPSTLIPPESGAYTPSNLTQTGVDLIQAQSTPPTGTQATTYYTSFNLSSTRNGVANNNIPLDPRADLSITKSALSLVTAVPSTYTVTVSNANVGSSAPSATMLESIPAGLMLNSIGGTGWTCTAPNGSALSLPVAGAVSVKCVYANAIASGASANPISVEVVPGLDQAGNTLTTYSSVDSTAGGNPPTPGPNCSPSRSCASNSGQVVLGTAKLFLQKTSSSTNVELGDSILYTLKLEHVSGDPQVGIKIADTLPLGFKYIANTAKLTRTGSSSTGVSGDSLLGVVGVGPQLNFNVGTMILHDVVTITYRVRLGVGSQQGTGINRAIATTASGSSSNEARATVKVTNGVFAQEGCIIGKVYLDCNHNGIQDQEDGDEPGIGGVRLYMEDGTYMVSDRQGKYSICGVSAMTHVLKVDKTTLPPGAELGITANRNALDPDSLFVDLKFGELHRADFLINNCSTDVLNDVDTRQDRSGAPMGTYPQPNNKQPTKSQSFSLKEQRAKQRFYQEGK